MTTKILIAGLSEQDLDLFLLEEVVSNSSFRSWFIQRVKGWPESYSELTTAIRSVTQFNGESDLEFIFRNPEGGQAKLLIENKLDASFQPQQLKRYHDRADTYVNCSDCHHAAVMLVAPSSYSRYEDGVDAVITYEEIEARLASEKPDERTNYKLALLRSALSKHRLGYNPDTDEPVTNFWLEYWKLTQSEAPALEMEAPGKKPAGAGFIWFFPSRLPGQLNICHKLYKGYVDLHFPGMGEQMHDMTSVVNPLMEEAMELVRANKSAAVRLLVPRLNAGQPFEAQIENVRTGVTAALRFLSWSEQNASALLQLMKRSAADSID